MPRDFPWASPEPGDLRDLGGRFNAATVRQIIEWFIERWGPLGYRLPPSCPLAEMIDALARHERGERPPDFRSPEEELMWRYRILALRRLTRSICILQGPAGPVRDVHSSFITADLANVDNREVSWTMPTGVGTLCLAARLLQASGGEMVITGAATPGHDIRWKPATGGEALIERKDRSLSPGESESLGRRVRYIVAKVREAGPRIPRIEGTARVLAIGFPGFIAPNQARRVRGRIESELSLGVGPSPSPQENPDYLIVEFAGSRYTLTGGYEMGTLSETIDFSFGRSEWLEVGRAFNRAYTGNGAREPGPWPIRAEYVRPVRASAPSNPSWRQRDAARHRRKQQRKRRRR